MTEIPVAFVGGVGIDVIETNEGIQKETYEGKANVQARWTESKKVASGKPGKRPSGMATAVSGTQKGVASEERPQAENRLSDCRVRAS